MKNVEQLFPGFQWAEALEQARELQVEQVGSELHITGLLPRYEVENHPADILGQYSLAANRRVGGNPRAKVSSPQISFANADSDNKLIGFVRRFGPVVAKCAYTNFERPEEGLPEPRLPPRLFAVQDMQELKNEHLIYRSALALIGLLNESDFDLQEAHRLVGEIAVKIADWPRQREREKTQGGKEPAWNLSGESLNRIKALASLPPGPTVPLPPSLDGRIVICELLNSFPSIVFPNPMELNSSIKYGIRPLLYALLRRQFLAPRDFSFCANTQCRNFFNIERAGQQFCSPECSIHQRQREYWAKSGKNLRAKRVKRQRKAKK